MSDAPRPADGIGASTRLTVPRTLFIGVVGGALSGLLGIGGGTIMVPLLVLSGGVAQRTAHALSLGAIIPISIASVAVYAGADEVDLRLALGLAIGAVVGARIGVGMLAQAPEHVLKLAFGVFLVAVAISMAVTT